MPKTILLLGFNFNWSEEIGTTQNFYLNGRFQLTFGDVSITRFDYKEKNFFSLDSWKIWYWFFAKFQIITRKWYLIKISIPSWGEWIKNNKVWDFKLVLDESIQISFAIMRYQHSLSMVVSRQVISSIILLFVIHKWD